MNEVTKTAPSPLATLDEDFSQDVAQMMEGIHVEPPRVRVLHQTNGKHKMYIDQGESYFGEDGEQETPLNKGLTGIVIQAQLIRALFNEGEHLPECAAVEGVQVVNRPLSDSCRQCAESAIGKGRCKPKIRLFILTQTKGTPSLVVFPLSPTSIKRWKSHLRKLAKSGAPYFAVVTRFKLQDTAKNGYRWALVTMDVERVVTKEELKKVREMRAEFKARMKEVNDRDFNDPGDKQSNHKEHHARTNQSHNGNRTIHGTDHSGQEE
jgi:hypothetical protein